MSPLTKSALFLIIACAISSSLFADVIITEVADGTLTGQQPKFVEITNVGSTDYTFPAGGGIIVQSNSNTDYDVDWPLDGLTLAPGQSWVVNSISPPGAEAATFLTVFGFDADEYATVAFGNGDDRYILTDGTGFLDIFGEDGVDATPSGETPAVWTYTDGYAYRIAGITKAKGLAFDPSEWVFGGADSLEAGTESEAIVLAKSVLTPGSYGATVDTSWGEFTIQNFDGTDWIDTGDWIGWIVLLGNNWYWSLSHDLYFYTPDPGDVPFNGIWIYALQ